MTDDAVQQPPLPSMDTDVVAQELADGLGIVFPPAVRMSKPKMLEMANDELVAEGKIPLSPLERMDFFPDVVAEILARHGEGEPPPEPTPEDVVPPPVQVGGVLQFGIMGVTNAGTVSSSITVPAGTEVVLVALSAYGRGDTLNYMTGGVVTLTKGGVDTPMTLAAGNVVNAWSALMWYMPMPDTGPGKSLKWNWVGNNISDDASKNWSMTFWKGVDKVSPVRDAQMTQKGGTPVTTPLLNIQSESDLVVAFMGGYNETDDPSSVDLWWNLTELALVPRSGISEGVWATARYGTRTTAGAIYVNGFRSASITAVVLRPPSADENIFNLPLVPWDGGSSYWAKFPLAHAAGWSDPLFFPIAAFLVKAEFGHPAALAALGINTAMSVEHQPPISQVTDHMFALMHTELSAGEWSLSDVSHDPRVVGWFVYDECEMGSGVCGFVPTDAERLALHQGWCDAYRALDDGRFIFANFGNGVLNTFWATGQMPQWLAQVDACGCDKYAYTSPNVQFVIDQALDFPGSAGQAFGRAAPSQTGASYGWCVTQLRKFDSFNESLRPNWIAIETQMPFLDETGRSIILYDQIAGAVWAAIVHEARGIFYFQQNGFYTPVNGGPPLLDPNTGTPPLTGIYSLIDGTPELRETVTAINAEVRGLAPAINTRSFVWDFRAVGIDTMLKYYSGYAYIFAVVAPGGATGVKTFTLPATVLGPVVEVFGEDRTVALSLGQFSDTFANEFTHHIYKVRAKRWPNADSAGVLTGMHLVASESLTVTTPGAVIELLSVTGTITVVAPDVTIRNCLINANGTDYGIDARDFNVNVRDCEIFGGVVAGVVGGGVWLRLDVYNFPVGLMPQGANLIEDCYVHNTSVDGIAVLHGVGAVIRHTRVEGTGRSCIFISDEDGAVSDTLVEQNSLVGVTQFTIQSDARGASGEGITGVQIRNNFLQTGSGINPETGTGYWLVEANTIVWFINRDYATNRQLPGPGDRFVDGASDATSAAHGVGLISAGYGEIVQAGSVLQISINSQAPTGTVTTELTVPDDAELAIVALSSYGLHQRTSFQSKGVVTLTKGGADTPMRNVASGADARDDVWEGAMWYMPLPDVGAGKSLKWDWLGDELSDEKIKNWSIIFYKGTNPTTPLRDDFGIQAKQPPLPIMTSTMEAQTGDTIVAFLSSFNAFSDGLSDVTDWAGLTELAEIPSFAYAEGAWATSRPSANTSVGALTGVHMTETALMAVVLKPFPLGTPVTVGLAHGVGAAQASVGSVSAGNAPGTGSGLGVAPVSGNGSANGVSQALSESVTLAGVTVTASGVGDAAALTGYIQGVAGAAAGAGIALGTELGYSLTTGAAGGVGTAAAADVVAKAASSAMTGTGAAAGAGAATKAGVGAMAGAGATAGVSRTIPAAAGAAAGVGAAAAVGGLVGTGVGSAAGVGAMSSTGAATKASPGIAAGVGAADATNAALKVAAGAAAGVGVASGKPPIRGAGASTGHGTAAATSRATKAGAGAAAGVGAASSGDLPLVPWAGGSAYWAQFPKADAAGWSDPSFFPIAVFLVRPNSTDGHPASLAAIGINTAMAVEYDPPISALTDHLFAIVQSPISHSDEAPNTWTQAEIGSDPNVVAWFIYDECEQGEGRCSAFSTDTARRAAFASWATSTRAFNDGRFMFANFGNGVLNTFWAPGTMNQWMAIVDGCAVDKYAYTAGIVRQAIEVSDDWPLGGTPADNSKISAAYGWFMDQMHGFDASNASRRPVWCFVETKMPYLTAGDPRDIILYAQIEGAVWAAIVHEANGIAYFQHNGFYTGAGAPTIDPNTGLPPDTDDYSLVQCEVGLRNAVGAINAKVASLASVINTQSRVWNFGATGIDTMLKLTGGFAYVFASVKAGGTTGSKTFTVPPGVTGTSVEVVGESRSLSVTSGHFTDTFANEYTHHVYKIGV